MRRLLLALWLTSPVFGLGCSMCDNPYDYCGPVVESGYHHGGYHGDYGNHGEYGEHEVYGAPVEQGRVIPPGKNEPTKAAPYYEGEQSTMAPPRGTVSVAKKPSVATNAEPGRLQSAPLRRGR